MIVWRDGEFLAAEAAISATDRGYLIGDGVFETVLVDRGRPAFLPSHLARLQRGANQLEIVADVKAEEIRAAITALARSGQTGRASCRITVTRVGGARGLVPATEARAQTIITLQPVAAPKAAQRLIVARSRRHAAALTNGFKCIGAYAPNLIARLEAARLGADEAIMLNEFDRAASASAANLFMVSDGVLTTPPEIEGAMPGVTRERLIEVAAALGIDVRIEPIAAAEVERAPLFLTNSLIGVIDAGVATLPPASLAKRLQAAYEERVQAEFSDPAP
ncbi:MAG: aminotransferase class IV [Parvularculaceae bacterium]|nr:aminotransferase class IV [Parvularculaceae bacterium]